MQRNSFLGDLLTTLFERGRRRMPGPDGRQIIEMCKALLSAEGEVSGQDLAASILFKYQTLSDTEKLKFFNFLNDEMEFDAARISQLANEYATTPSVANFTQFSRASEPKRQELLRRLNQPPGATPELVAMRLDLLNFMAKHPDLKRTDIDFVHLLKSWFNRGFLVLRLINWDTAATILEKIVAYEAVHAIDDWEDLRRRLHPPDRRCFAFFHPTMPEEPLIFVEVALTKSIPGSVQGLLTEERDHLPAEEATTAVFYSISNCQRGLQGISFGNLLIKQVVSVLRQDYPNLQSYVTLSPVPGFNRWLTSLDGNGRAEKILSHSSSDAELREMAAYYLLKAKRPDGLPLDPVTRFHLGNGATLHDIHAKADTTLNGMKNSSGVMVNYLYDLSQTEKNHEDFIVDKKVPATKTVQTLANAPHNPG